jgi:transcription elongation factor Elf1
MKQRLRKDRLNRFLIVRHCWDCPRCGLKDVMSYWGERSRDQSVFRCGICEVRVVIEPLTAVRSRFCRAYDQGGSP